MAAAAPALLPDAIAVLAGSPTTMDDPFRVWNAMRSSGRVFDAGSSVVLTHHADVKAGLSDAARFSNTGPTEGTRMEALRIGLDDESRRAFDEVLEMLARFISRQDGEDHLRLRRVGHRLFTPRRVVELEGQAQQHTDRLLGELFDAEVVDAMTFAYRLPLMMIADLLGVPQEDAEMVHGWTMRIQPCLGSGSAQAYLDAHSSLKEFEAYVDDLFDAHHEATERPDLVSLFVAAEEEERMSREELVSLCIQLLFAGHETTMTLISGSLYQLLSRPGRWQWLAEDADRIPNTVEEVLRFTSPIQLLDRMALEDLELGGVEIPAGTTVVMSIAAANRDPEVFDHPDVFDPERTDAGGHLGFGFGPHFCLGNALARLQGRVVLTAIARRYPGLQLASDEVSYEGGAMLRHLKRLEVSPGTAAAA